MLYVILIRFQRQYPLDKMIALLRDYTNHLKAVDQSPEGARKSNVESYYMPADMVSANEWADFENVYQVHSPNLFMCSDVRDVSFILLHVVRPHHLHRF